MFINNNSNKKIKEKVKIHIRVRPTLNNEDKKDFVEIIDAKILTF